MRLPWGFGPVFEYEMLISSRRWQLYAGRALLVAGLLAGLSVVFVNRWRYYETQSIQGIAALGQAFFHSIMLVELLLTLLAVPAATAGAVCVDKMRGGLLLTLVTDLTDFEIVFGKLASRLVAVLGVLACGMPAYAITSWMGGVDPWDAFGATLVIVGLAVLAVSVTLTFSVWATRPNEALMATYATWIVWLLALPVWWWLNHGSRGGAVEWILAATNPFALVLGNSISMSQWFGPMIWLQLVSFAASVGVSLFLAIFCVKRIRRVTVAHAGKSQRARDRKPLVPRLRFPLPSVAIDGSPLLWREQRFSTTRGMARKVWIVYVVLSMLFVAVSVLVNGDFETKALGGGLMVAVGLLFVSTSAATRFAEERAHGSLDVLLTTPLTTREIVVGKAWGAYRDVPALAVLAGVLCLGMRLWRDHPVPAVVSSALLAALVLAYGAVVTSVGVASAVHQSRVGRAIGLSVTSYLVAAVIYPFGMIFFFRAGPEDVVLLWPSPLFGVFMQLERAGGFRIDQPGYNMGRVAVLAALTILAARLVQRVTVRAFDRLLGRVPDRGRRYARSDDRLHVTGQFGRSPTITVSIDRHLEGQLTAIQTTRFRGGRA